MILVSDTFRLYGDKALKFKTLSDKKRDELLKRYSEGDKIAFDKLVKGNLGLVSYVIEKYYKNSKEDEKEEFFQEGIVGLELAIKNYDISLEIKFST